MGLVNYYSEFMSNLATVLYSLNQLLRLDTKWNWTTACDQALSTVKKKLVSNQLLVHYDSHLPLRLATDPFAYGVGAVISH